jgi:hypothetical protein
VKSHSGRAAELWKEVMRRTEADYNGFFMGFRMMALIELAGAIHQEGWPVLPPLLVPTSPK